MRIQINDKGQSVAPKTIKMNKDNFSSNNETAIYWMGNASMMINSRGTNIMIDPLLEGFDMPLLIDMPILPKDIPSLDGLLITHIDNDHFSRPTCKDVLNVCQSYHAPHYVAEVMREEGIPGIGHNINEAFSIKNINIKSEPKMISTIKSSEYERLDTGIKELNRVLGGGIVKGSLTLISGSPGIGKSTILLQAANNIATN